MSKESPAVYPVQRPGKVSWRPGNILNPAPAVLLSCGSTPQTHNLITVAWAGTICSDPAMLSVSIRPERHSYGIIMSEMQFTVNLTTAAMARATDWCGVRSGRDYNKWKETGLTPVEGIANTCPFVGESPVAIECKVKDIISLGTHDMFIAQVVNVIVDQKYIDPQTGALNLQGAEMLVYCHGGYYRMGDFLGKFGFSVAKTRK